MNQILTATYSDGKLILSEKLDPSLEGQTVELTLINLDPTLGAEIRKVKRLTSLA